MSGGLSENAEGFFASASQDDIDAHWMHRAIVLGQQAAAVGEVPVGAVLVEAEQLIAEGYNQPIGSHDPSAHAEIVVLRAAARRKQNYRLPGTTLYVTVEPCTMCVGALVHARVKRLVFGAREPRAGAVVSQMQLLDGEHYNHQLRFTPDVCAEDCAELMRRFFRSRR